MILVLLDDNIRLYISKFTGLKIFLMFFLAKLVLAFFDRFTQVEVFKFIQSTLNNKINTLLDVVLIMANILVV